MTAVRLLNRQSGEIVEAELVVDPSQAVVVDTELRWQHFRDLAEERLLREGIPIPESQSWDWENKFTTADRNSVRFFAIDRLGRIEGLMMLAISPRVSRARNAADDKVLYVEFLEAAPWNLPGYVGEKAEFKGIGITLLACAVGVSMETGCKGMIGLHSLPQAEAFYLHLGFDDLGLDDSEGCHYFFELSQEPAANALKGDWQ